MYAVDTNIIASINKLKDNCTITNSIFREAINHNGRAVIEFLGCKNTYYEHEKPCVNLILEKEILSKMSKLPRPIGEVKEDLEVGNIALAWLTLKMKIENTGANVEMDTFAKATERAEHDCTLISMLEANPSNLLVTEDKILLDVCKARFGKRCLEFSL